MNLKKQSNKSSEPTTMGELLAKFGQTIKGLTTGQKVKAKVLEIGKKSVSLDIGGKSEAIVTESAYEEARDFIKSLSVGDEVLATVIAPEDKQGTPLLSLRQAAANSTWEMLEEALKNKKPVFATANAIADAGIGVSVESLLGFIPSSQLGKNMLEKKADMQGKRFLVRVVELDRSRNKIVLSEKAVSEAIDVGLQDTAISSLKEGEIIEGIVTTVTNFGAFVEISLTVSGKTVKVEGLVHVSELSWQKVSDPRDIVKSGDRLKVKIVGIKDSRIALSVKQALADPWQKAGEKYIVDKRLKAKVTRISNFGVFVELEPGIEGLIHLTKIPPTVKLTTGETVDCYIEEIDPNARKISLGLILKTKPVGYK